jgi:hypothetical protein
MPLAFSFFGSKHRLSPPEPPVKEELSVMLESVGDEGLVTSLNSIPESPFPRNDTPLPAGDADFPSKAEIGTFESLSTIFLPPLNSSSAAEVVLPERRGTSKGLAGMVVRQSELEAPPLNKRSPFPTSPFTTALSSPFAELPTRLEANPPAPQPSSVTAVPEVDVLRQELNGEIEQVKNDLFGAVMGVSALKDRLDGLEAQLSRVESAPTAPLPEPPPALEIEPIITSWLDDHLPAAIERMLAEAQLKMLGTPGAAFFRSSIPLSEAERQNLFSQPPVILNSAPV